VLKTDCSLKLRRLKLYDLEASLEQRLLQVLRLKQEGKEEGGVPKVSPFSLLSLFFDSFFVDSSRFNMDVKS
jgi:hypothetical protein